MPKVVLPHKIEPRHYQKELWNAIFRDNYKHVMPIWHRRAGKSRFLVNVMTAWASRSPCAIYHLFPTQNQAKKVIWEGRGSAQDPIAFIDQIPKRLIKNVNNQEMKITFKNGSIFRLGGTDRKGYDSLVGINPSLIIYDEFAVSNPAARDYLNPVLMENGGTEIIATTVRGRNHLYDLYQNVVNSDKWFVQNRTVEDTLRNDGTPVVTQAMIEETRRDGWSEDKIRQEFYNDFNASVRGAIFSNELDRAQKDGRIRDFPIETTIPVDTFWDLGLDGTSVWLVQRFNREIRLIGYYEKSDEDIGHYINWLNIFRNKYGLTFGKHYGPHDVNRRSIADKNVSVINIAKRLGIKFERIDRTKDIMGAIELAKGIFSRCYFHATNCKSGLACLQQYHLHYYEHLQAYGDKPVHDWSSHGADAFRGIAQFIDKVRMNGASVRITKNPVIAQFR